MSDESRLLREIEADPDFRAPVLRIQAARQTATLLRTLRRDAGLTQRELARRLGVSQARISQVESGDIDHLPPLDFIHLFADACGRRLTLSPEAGIAGGPVSFPSPGEDARLAEELAPGSAIDTASADGGATVDLPKPSTSLEVVELSLAMPETGETVVRGVGFKLSRGDVLVVVGPNGSGQSPLLQAIAGLWPPASGSVRLDGASLNQYRSQTLASTIGYMAEDFHLRRGTVAENIAGFHGVPVSELVIEAAQSAGLHHRILRLPQGYETQVESLLPALSRGEQQRIALARALYGEPWIVVLDSPGSNLDSEGEEELMAALSGIKARGGIAIVTAHRLSILGRADHVLVMKDGRMQLFGPPSSLFAPRTSPADEHTKDTPVAADAVPFPSKGRR
ncbi:MAG: ATP-binding cassette domain-containing protein [Rhizobiaceae bacterium]|nr:ATP-binding cassette domain-containing protein [Rhizobiaceae bacterium]